jgi:hypothetical protein
VRTDCLWTSRVQNIVLGIHNEEPQPAVGGKGMVVARLARVLDNSVKARLRINPRLAMAFSS